MAPSIVRDPAHIWSPFQGKAEAAKLAAMIQLVIVLASTENCRIQLLGIRPNFSADGGRGDRLLVLLAVLARVEVPGLTWLCIPANGEGASAPSNAPVSCSLEIRVELTLAKTPI